MPIASSSFSLISLTLLTLMGFAANSLICRLVLKGAWMDPLYFTVIRLWSGVIFFLGLRLLGHRQSLTMAKTPLSQQLLPVLALLIYALFFSLSYQTIAASQGALILFGVVQFVLFAKSYQRGEELGLMTYFGWLLAIAGLLILTQPWQQSFQGWPSFLMAIAGVSWAIYTLLGRKVQNPIAATERNFLGAAIFALVLFLLFGEKGKIEVQALAWAFLSGSLTSAAAYALWYQVLPRWTRLEAGVWQLTTPLFTAMGAFFFLDESWSISLSLAFIFIVGGLFLSLLASQRAEKSS